MLKKVYTCNRCSRIIEEEHPDRITIATHITEDYTDGFGKPHTRSVYKTGQSMHFCSTCRALLDRFLNNE